MVVTGNLPWLRGLLLLPTQLLGGIVAAALVKCMFPGPLAVSTTLSGGTSPAQGVFIEMFLTMLLVFTILMLAAEKHYATFMAPVGIGLALFVDMLAGKQASIYPGARFHLRISSSFLFLLHPSITPVLPPFHPSREQGPPHSNAGYAGVHWTGASMNPARSFGPAVAIPYFPTYHYIYWFGPVMGALVAAGYYRFVKFFNYEQANPGQDAIDDREKEREDLERGPPSS